MSVPGEPDGYGFGGFRLDPGRRRLYAPDGQALTLRTKVFDILLYLVEHAGQLVTKAALMEAIWPDLVVEENNLNQAVSALRQCLGDDRQNPTFIATVTGRGYQFVARVERIAADARAQSDAQSLAARGSFPPAARPDAGEAAAAVAAGPTAGGVSRWKPAVAAAVVALAAVLGATLVLNLVSPESPDGAASRGASSGLDAEPAQLVTDYAGSHSAPTLSPDGTLMAFVSTASGTPQIWVTGLPHGEPIRITSGDQPATSPSWSPRNDQILFQRATANGVPGIWSVDPLGATEPRLVIDVGTTPSFGADGSSFVYAIGRNIWMAKADGTERRPVAGVPGGPGFEPARSPALSPDGALVAFVHAEQGPVGSIWLVPVAAGAAARPLLPASEGALGIVAADPVFSADGRYVIYAAAVDSIANRHLWRAPVDGGDPEQLTSGVGGYGSPAVAPNGSRMAYTSERVVYRLMRTDPGTGIHRSIHESRNPIVLPVLSPDGRDIAFFSGSTTATQVVTIGADGSNRRQRTFEEDMANTLPVWSADGEWIYYYRDQTLRRIARTGERNEEVDPDFHWTSRHWLIASGDRIAFRERNLAPGVRRTVVRDLAQGTEIDLPMTFSPTGWSRDGSTILGFSQEPGTAGRILLCAADASGCRVLTGDDGPILGTEARWSIEESRIFFRRSSGRPNHSMLWVADADGSNLRMLFEFGPFDVEFSDSYFGVAEGDEIVWNQSDAAETEEIWVVGIGGR